MIAALTLGTLLFLTALALHFAMLRLAHRVAPPTANRTPAQTLSGQLVVLVSHLLVALLFAAGLALAVEAGLGGFAKE